MISSLVSRVSAFLLFVGGAALLFAADQLLPMLAPGFPRDAAWLGQLLAAAWLGLAALDWMQRTALLVLVPLAVMALVYGALMLRGPFDPLQPPSR